MFFQLEGPLCKEVQEKKVHDMKIDPELNIIICRKHFLIIKVKAHTYWKTTPMSKIQTKTNYIAPRNLIQTIFLKIKKIISLD